MRRLLAIALLVPALAWGVSGVNPTGVNIRATGPSTAFLTFQNLDPNEQVVEAFWCGELVGGVTGGSVATANPCVPGTLYGFLPLRNNLATESRSGSFRNLTDVMTIPPAVTRRAYQDAIAGRASDFFYVRRFSGGVGGDKWVVVTCRMGGGGARSPLALMDVRVAFESSHAEAPVLAIERGKLLPAFGARILYNGAGVLRGRWEVVMPGDVQPSDEDLLTEASLPAERRGLQRRYTLLTRFEQFLTGGSEIVIAGPDPRTVPTAADGAYQILLRIEASDDKEADSNTGGTRVVHAGGVAGFPMPVLRYFVGTRDALDAVVGAAAGLVLLAPAEGAGLPADRIYAWAEVAGAALYRVELAADSQPVFRAFVRPGSGQYQAPEWLAARPNLRWRVVALDAAGRETAASAWRRLSP